MRKYVFADESGCFAFERNGRASKYFIICTVELEDRSIIHKLTELRHDLIWRGAPIGEFFHATADKQIVRDAVFDLLRAHPMNVGATILEKSKAMPHIRATKQNFYKHAWFFHLSGVAKKLRLTHQHEVLFTTASIGTKKGQATFTSAVRDVLSQRIYQGNWKTHFCQSMADVGLQIADYCTWAIQRKWERGDSRSYDLIKHAVYHEYDTWEKGTTHYY
ncbi:MAG: DUF3800 domain-containing protein [Sinobacteraceae bacterium]|nr:DUF3800 domain-containing protein [Nevskiaceae bacterium]